MENRIIDFLILTSGERCCFADYGKDNQDFQILRKLAWANGW